MCIESTENIKIYKGDGILPHMCLICAEIFNRLSVNVSC